MNRTITIALAGNPNAGKTTIFNHYTGARQHVANYPGVTVEKHQGRCRHRDVEINLIDLPGTYSLTAHSLDERVARDFILNEKPDVVIDVADASNIERSLYLAVQLIELRVPMVLALNMSDAAAARGIEFDLDTLCSLLGVPIVATVGHKGRGLADLLDQAVAVANQSDGHSTVPISYGQEIDAQVDAIQATIEQNTRLAAQVEPRWLAVKLLESDQDVLAKIQQGGDCDAILAATQDAVTHVEKLYRDHAEIVIADRRYGFISGACQETVRWTVEARHNLSDRIDAVLTHPVLGVPIFLAMMYGVFYLTFTIGEAPMGWIETGFAWLGSEISGLWPRGAESPLQSLLIEGVIGGVGGVVVFLPNILLLFLGISLLEDTGYMARAAFIMDRFMHKIGLHGKSFIPMLVGFGCTVPAIMATRMLESRRDRLTTILVLPLMSCGARLPIYALIIPAFFPKAWHAPMLWIIYLIGIALAVLGAKLLRSTILSGETTPLVMELPPYRIPTVRSVVIHLWERGWLYLRKAGTVILVISIIMWAMTSYPVKTQFDRPYDAETAAAEQARLGQLRTIASQLGLTDGSDTLAKAIDTNVAPNDTSPAIRAFIETVSAIDAIYATFDTAVGQAELQPDSPAYIALVHHRDNTLQALAKTNRTVFAAASAYRSDIRPGCNAALTEIEQSREAELLAWSITGRIGRAIEPAIKPLGFDWRIGTALIGAFAAKEVFVAQMGIVFAVGQADETSDALRTKLRAAYSPLNAFCIMIFCLIATPCVATLAVTRREAGGWKWAMFQTGSLTAMAYVLVLTIYQMGSLIGVGL